ncbi:hypothetical protein GCM10008961_12740 [Deinococcus knuensis]|uniref:Uncharacterized protein n=1 Tax=Deinococcus knuensis TaxID=1837380 RepID=A0ABQ2SDM3_9DEIO|nr:hypothetical protein GCM10008961_12740 [Deinococcus knuensis]
MPVGQAVTATMCAMGELLERTDAAGREVAGGGRRGTADIRRAGAGAPAEGSGRREGQAGGRFRRA